MPIAGDLSGGGGTTGSICAVSPSDMAGQIDNLLSRVEALEQETAELKAQNTSAIQLSDLSPSVGWVYDVTYMGVSGWIQTEAGTLIPPAGFTVSEILANAQAGQLSISGISGSSAFGWAQVGISGSGGSISSIGELVDTGIVTVSNPNIYISTSGLYLFGFHDSLSITVTSASYGFMEVSDPNFLLPGQARVAGFGLVMTGSSSGAKFAEGGSTFVTTVPSAGFQLKATCGATAGTWLHTATLSILKLG